MLVWFSGSDNTLLEPGRGLTSSLSSPKPFIPQFLFLVQLQWICALIPRIKPSISLSLPFPFFLLLYTPLFCQDLFFFPFSSHHFLFLWLFLATILQWAHITTDFALEELVNRRNNSLPLWLWRCILRLGGLSWKINSLYCIIVHYLNRLILLLFPAKSDSPA